MRVLLAGLVVLLAGCAGREEAPPPRALRFAAFVSPRVAGTAAEGVLLEVVTALSSEAALDFVLVGGPLVGSQEAADRDALAGALGSIAAPVYVALAPDDATPDVLESLEQGVQKHPGEAAHAGPPVAGWRPMAIAPDGALPEVAGGGDGPAFPVVAVRAGAAPPPDAVRLLISRNAEPTYFGERRDGRVELGLPPLDAPPHVYAIVTVEPTGEVKTELRALLPEPPIPPALVPLFVDLPRERP